MKNIFILMSLLGVVLVGYNNCGSQHALTLKGNSTSSSQLSGATTAQSVEIFKNTVYPVLRSNCAACHATNVSPLHSSSDVNAAHAVVIGNQLVNLSSPAQSRLVIKILNGHQSLSSAVANSLSTQISAWASQLSQLNSSSGQQSTVSNNSNINNSNTNASNSNVNNGVSNAMSASSVQIFSNTLHPLLKTNCGSCHGANTQPLHAAADVTTAFNSIMNSGLADLTSPASSRLVTKINSGHQGFSPSLASAIENQITSWAQQLATANGGTLPAVGTKPPALTNTFQSISNLILIPKCVSCHGPNKAKEGIRYDSYDLTLRTVSKGNASKSKLYRSVSGGSMPENADSLTAEELAAISGWINAGAANN